MPIFEYECRDCHDSHGSANGNPYNIRDTISGSSFTDDGYRLDGFTAANPGVTIGVNLTVAADGLPARTIDWGALCIACHEPTDWWQTGKDWWHDTDAAGGCGDSCQTCHNHGAAWHSADWVDFNNATPCP